MKALNATLDPGLVRAAHAAASAASSSLDKIESSSHSAGSAVGGIGRQARSTASGIEHLATRFTTLTTAILAANAIQNTLNNAFQGITGAVFGMNANLETSTLQFKTLMGSADLAKEHVAGLFEFAKRTPFAAEPIIQASLALENAGGAALNTLASLTLLGDAAATSNAPIQEMAFWVGRVYSALQSGKPFGEATMRLQELKVLSPQAVVELDRLTAAGANGSEIWRVLTGDLARFGGGMEEQAETWRGLTSTLGDTLNSLLAGTFKPFFDTAKSGIKGLNELLDTPAVAEWADNAAANFTVALTNLGTMKDGWVEHLKTMTGPEQGLGFLDAALKATGLVIGEEIGERAKKDFEETTGAIANTVGGTRDLVVAINDLTSTGLVGWLKEVASFVGFVVTAPAYLINAAGSAAGALGETLDQALRTNVGNEMTMSGGIPVTRSDAESRLAEARAAQATYFAGLAQSTEEGIEQVEEAVNRTRPPRTPPPPVFAGGVRGGGARAGGGGVARAEKEAETAIMGFMEAMGRSEANMEAQFGNLGGKLATALNEALLSNSKSAGVSLGKTMEDVVTVLRESGVEDWRETGDLLAEALHNALIDRLPATQQAALDLIGQFSETIKSAQFWSEWAKEGEKAAEKINVAIQDSAVKVTEAWRTFAQAKLEAERVLADTRWLDTQRQAVDDFVDIIQRAQAEGTRTIGAGREDRDRTRREQREDEDALAAHQDRLREIRNRGSAVKSITQTEWQAALARGETSISRGGGGDETAVENKRFAAELVAVEKRRSREAADRDQRSKDQNADIARQLGNEQNLTSARLALEKALGIDKETLQNVALGKQIANLETVRDVSIAAANTYIESVSADEQKRLDTIWGTLTKKFDILKPVADVVLDGMLADAERIAELVSGASGGSTGGNLRGEIPPEDMPTGNFANRPGTPAPPPPTEGPEFPTTPPEFALGGMVPGPFGKPLHAIVHGGELIIPPGRLPSPTGGGGRGNTIIQVDLSNATIYGVEDLEATIIKAVQRADRVGALRLVGR